MDTDPTDDPRSAAVEQLEHLGLSSYAARTFVALVSLERGTAKEVSEVSSVPRTRVYDAIDELHGHGLVDVQQSSPKEFWAISAESTGRKFSRELDHRASTLRTALDELEPAARSEEQRGVWTVDGQQAVTDRVLEFLDDAEQDIVYMTVGELLTEDVVDALAAAADRGVSITLGGVSPPVHERIRDVIPEAEVFDSVWRGSDTPAGRLMMVDESRTLVSVLVNGVEDAATAPRTETAIWAAGDRNSLVIVLKGLFTWRHRNGDPST